MTGSVIVVGHRGGNVSFWNVDAGKALRVVNTHKHHVTYLVLVNIRPGGSYGSGAGRCDHHPVVSG